MALSPSWGRETAILEGGRRSKPTASHKWTRKTRDRMASHFVAGETATRAMPLPPGPRWLENVVHARKPERPSGRGLVDVLSGYYPEPD